MDGSHAAFPAHGPEHDGLAHGSLHSYVTGFLLSVLLTAVPFALVMSGAVSASVAVPTALVLGVAQMIVHLIYFLHMNGSSGYAWNAAALVFTVIIVAIVVVGSLWVMYHLNTNMMPGMMPHAPSQ